MTDTSKATVSSEVSAASRARRIGGAVQVETRPSPGPSSTTRALLTDTPVELTPQPPRRRPVRLLRGQPGEMTGLVRALPWISLVVVAAVVAALASLNVAAWRAHHGGPSTQTIREQVLASAKSSTALVLTYNYATLAKNQEAADAHLTGQWKTQYDQSMKSVIAPQAPAQKAVVTGQVVKAGIVAISGDQATVAVFAQQSVTNLATKTPRQDLVNLIVTLTHARNVHGAPEWLISNLAQTD